MNHSQYAIIVFVLALLLLTGCQSGQETRAVKQQAVQVQADKPALPAVETSPEPPLKTFKLEGRNFRFIMDGVESPDLRVSKGDRVRIELTGGDMVHDWVVDEFGAATTKVSAGESTTVEFIADSTGTFEYYCSVGAHRANGMVGKLIVE
ncbi:cupredoxin domain-containing protein [Candidatus Woesearchaeota archaeon]|nr:cupredoxin domain-containing protein [Candidatus Woesearchaeota archaeon]